MSVRPSGPGSGSGPVPRHPDVLSMDKPQIWHYSPMVHWRRFLATVVYVWLCAEQVWLLKEKLFSPNWFPEARELVSGNGNHTSGGNPFRIKVSSAPCEKTCGTVVVKRTGVNTRRTFLDKQMGSTVVCGTVSIQPKILEKALGATIRHIVQLYQNLGTAGHENILLNWFPCSKKKKLP